MVYLMTLLLTVNPNILPGGLFSLIENTLKMTLIGNEVFLIWGLIIASEMGHHNKSL